MNCPHFTVSSINNIKCKKILNRINPDLEYPLEQAKLILKSLNFSTKE